MLFVIILTIIAGFVAFKKGYIKFELPKKSILTKGNESVDTSVKIGSFIMAALTLLVLTIIIVNAPIYITTITLVGLSYILSKGGKNTFVTAYEKFAEFMEKRNQAE